MAHYHIIGGIGFNSAIIAHMREYYHIVHMLHSLQESCSEFGYLGGIRILHAHTVHRRNHSLGQQIYSHNAYALPAIFLYDIWLEKPLKRCPRQIIVGIQTRSVHSAENSLQQLHSIVELMISHNIGIISEAVEIVEVRAVVLVRCVHR